MNAFRIAWRASRDLFDELFTAIAVNLLWVVINLPLLGVAFSLGLTAMIEWDVQPLFLAALVLMLAVIPLGPSSTGLTLVAQRIFEGRSVSWRLFADGFRAPRNRSWQVYAGWMAVFIILLVNIAFYTQIPPPYNAFLTMFFLYVVILWVAVLIHLGPLVVLQEDRSVVKLFRNALILMLGRPVATLITMLLMTIIVLLSIAINLIPLLLLTPVWLAVWGFRATAQAIEEIEERRRALQNPTDDGPPAAGGRGRRGQIRPRD